MKKRIVGLSSATHIAGVPASAPFTNWSEFCAPLNGSAEGTTVACLFNVQPSLVARSPCGASTYAESSPQAANIDEGSPYPQSAPARSFPTLAHCPCASSSSIFFSMEDTCFETSSSWASSQVESATLAAVAAVAAVAANAMTQVEKIQARLKLLLTAALLNRSYRPRSHERALSQEARRPAVSHPPSGEKAHPNPRMRDERRKGFPASCVGNDHVDREEVKMPQKRANVKNEKQYEALKDKGMSKERAAKIANSPGASSRGGKKSGSGGSPSQGGTTAQKKAAGRKGGKATARKRS